jgi:hypothetical protein
VKNAFWRRLRRHWRWNLAETYAQALSIMRIVSLVTFVALRFEIAALANLVTSLLDARPWLFFLLAWCLVRSYQLIRDALFGHKFLNSRFVERLRKATTDALLIMLSSFLGIVSALLVHGTKQTDSNLLALGLVVSFAFFFPLGIALGIGDVRQGLSRPLKRWSSVIAAILMLVWMGMNGTMSEHKAKPQLAQCPPKQIDATVATSSLQSQ